MSKRYSLRRLELICCASEWAAARGRTWHGGCNRREAAGTNKAAVHAMLTQHAVQQGTCFMVHTSQRSACHAHSTADRAPGQAADHTACRAGQGAPKQAAPPSAKSWANQEAWRFGRLPATTHFYASLPHACPVTGQRPKVGRWHKARAHTRVVANFPLRPLQAPFAAIEAGRHVGSVVHLDPGAGWLEQV